MTNQLTNIISLRANRAQYAEVAFQTVADDDVIDVSLPSMQGTAEDEGWSHCFK